MAPWHLSGRNLIVAAIVDSGAQAREEALEAKRSATTYSLSGNGWICNLWIWLKIIDTPNRWFPTKYNHSCGSFGTLILIHCQIPIRPVLGLQLQPGLLGVGWELAQAAGGHHQNHLKGHFCTMAGKPWHR